MAIAGLQGIVSLYRRLRLLRTLARFLALCLFLSDVVVAYAFNWGGPLADILRVFWRFALHTRAPGLGCHVRIFIECGSRAHHLLVADWAGVEHVSNTSCGWLFAY